MKVLEAIVRRTLHLIVDDWWLAAAILVWIGLVWVAFPAIGVAGTGRGILLFVGLAGILAASSWRKARQQREKGAR